MTDRELSLLRSRLAPLPQNISFHDGEEYRLADGCQFELVLPENVAGGEKILTDIAQKYWHITPIITTAAGGGDLHKEGYTLKITADKALITASTADGVRNALKTLRQLAEPARGKRTFDSYLLPQCDIADAPALEFRGIHLCYFPETRPVEIERAIRLAAYCKFNAVVLEFWGIFPFECAPEVSHPEYTIDRATARKFVDVAKEENIMLIPQLNLFGHASFSRVSSGKHSTLEIHPELQALFEPDGWSWCFSNPETVKLLDAMALELHDFFGAPPYFHIGCDEIYNAYSCALCRKEDPVKIFHRQLMHFHDLFAKRNTRIMMWHDMLLEHGDPRWKGFVALGYKGIEKVVSELPKDIFICDWQYYFQPPADGTAMALPTPNYFHEAGFPVLVAPWHSIPATMALLKEAKKINLDGMLMTTWHYNYSSSIWSEFVCGAMAAWQQEAAPPHHGDAVSIGNHYLRQIAWDMGLSKYEDCGSTYLQVNQIYR